MELIVLALASGFAAEDVHIRQGSEPGMSITYRPDVLFVHTLNKTRIDLRRVSTLNQWRS